MSDRKNCIANIPVRGPGGVNNIRVEARYNVGGLSTWTHEPIERGYSVHVQPEALEYQDGCAWRKYTPMSGLKKHCLAAKAFNAKTFDRFCDGALALAQPLIDRVVFTYGLELVAPTPTEE